MCIPIVQWLCFSVCIPIVQWLCFSVCIPIVQWLCFMAVICKTIDNDGAVLIISNFEL